MADRDPLTTQSGEPEEDILLWRPVHEEVARIWPPIGALHYLFTPLKGGEAWHYLICPTCAEKQREPLGSPSAWAQSVSGPYPQYRYWVCIVCDRMFQPAVHEFRAFEDTVSCSLCWAEDQDARHRVAVSGAS